MIARTLSSVFFFFNDTATTEIYTLSLHDALPILRRGLQHRRRARQFLFDPRGIRHRLDRKSTRLNSSHLVISYAVFCLKKKNTLESMYLSIFTSRSAIRPRPYSTPTFF